jgi:large subunit ribosomal protein L10
MPNKKNISEFNELKEVFLKANSIFFTRYQGLNVSAITKLRGELFKSDVEFRVAKNTLLKLALDEAKLPKLDDVLKGDTAIAISYDNPVAPAKVLKEFIKDYDLPAIKGIIVQGESLSIEYFEKLAKMDSKEALLSKLISMLQSPLQNLVSTLNAPMQNTVGVLKNIKK